MLNILKSCHAIFADNLVQPSATPIMIVTEKVPSDMVPQRYLGAQLALRKLTLPTQPSPAEEWQFRQQTLYLVQAAGIKVGYWFCWRTGGPYSSLLDEHMELHQFDDISATLQFDATTQKKIDGLQPLLKPPITVKLLQPMWVTLLAAVHYVVYRNDVIHEVNPVLEKLLSCGFDFNPTQVGAALETMVQFDVLREK